MGSFNGDRSERHERSRSRVSTRDSTSTERESGSREGSGILGAKEARPTERVSLLETLSLGFSLLGMEALNIGARARLVYSTRKERARVAKVTVSWEVVIPFRPKKEARGSFLPRIAALI